MESYNKIKLFQELCKSKNKWGLYISITWPASNFSIEEIEKACPFLKYKEHGQIIWDEEGYFLFDSQEECDHHFYLCVGDDGPTPLNEYKGEVKIYALTCGPDGNLQNENT